MPCPVGVGARIGLHTRLPLPILYGVCIHRESRAGAYLAQSSCNTSAIVWALQVEGGGCNDDWLVHKIVEVNEYLVKAKARGVKVPCSYE